MGESRGVGEKEGGVWGCALGWVGELGELRPIGVELESYHVVKWRTISNTGLQYPLLIHLHTSSHINPSFASVFPYNSKYSLPSK